MPGWGAVIEMMDSVLPKQPKAPPPARAGNLPDWQWNDLQEKRRGSSGFPFYKSWDCRVMLAHFSKYN